MSIDSWVKTELYKVEEVKKKLKWADMQLKLKVPLSPLAPEVESGRTFNFSCTSTHLNFFLTSLTLYSSASDSNMALFNT